VAVSRKHDAATARNLSLSTEMRLLAAARSAIEPRGHAHFKRFELRQILEVPDRQSGALGPLSPSALTRAIKRLVDGGVLLDGSWAQCLILPMFDVMTGQNIAPSACPVKPRGGIPIGG
jgi:hypothetical protein